mmetsp:Transcript_35332/g.64641  ORF Transcript_35332/g.64641 Transcript_35332/m.64641 type:complete len:201 (-) Transcript_35332:1775-2377(-)
MPATSYPAWSNIPGVSASGALIFTYSTQATLRTHWNGARCSPSLSRILRHAATTLAFVHLVCCLLLIKSITVAITRGITARIQMRIAGRRNLISVHTHQFLENLCCTRGIQCWQSHPGYFCKHRWTGYVGQEVTFSAVASSVRRRPARSRMILQHLHAILIGTTSAGGPQVQEAGDRSPNSNAHPFHTCRTEHVVQSSLG